MFNILISIVSNALETQAPVVKKVIQNFNHKSMMETEKFEEECKLEIRRKENALRAYQKKNVHHLGFCGFFQQKATTSIKPKKVGTFKAFFESLDIEKKRLTFIKSN